MNDQPEKQNISNEQKTQPLFDGLNRKIVPYTHIGTTKQNPM